MLTAGKSKGFGRRQTYESLTCRNPRWAVRGLWGFRILVGLALCSIAFRTACADEESPVLIVEPALFPGLFTPDLGHRLGAAAEGSKRDCRPKRVCLDA